MNEAAEVEKLGWEAIAKAQPNGTLPMWLMRNATSNKMELEKGLWELAIYIFKKRELQPGESWENRPDGSKLLVRTEPTSGEKRVVLTYEADENARVTLFRVKIEMQLRRATILEAANVSDMDSEIFDLYYE